MLLLALAILSLSACDPSIFGCVHQWEEWKIIVEPTCENPGTKTRSCTLCGCDEEEDIAAKNHTAGEWIVDKEPTCTEDGKRHTECTSCGITITAEAIPEAGHTAGEWIVDKEPTCAEAGERHTECTSCGITITTEAIPEAGHTADEWIVDKEPTCAEAGERHTECTSCGITLESETIEKSDAHIYKYDTCIYCKITSENCFEFIYLEDSDSYEIRAKANYSLPNDIVIPSRYNGKPVTSIGDNAFLYCDNYDNIHSVVIPDSVNLIGEGAFAHCEDLEAITVDKNNQHYKSIDGNLYSKDGTILIQYAAGKTDATFEIPYGVITVGERAFESCSRLTSVVIGDSITTISDYAFAHCGRLTDTIVPNSVKTIGLSAFSYCFNLKSVVIGSGVETIGEYVFDYCENLADITVDQNNRHYKSIDGNLYSKDGTILIQYATGKTDATFEIPSNVTTISQDAFYFCDSLTGVVIGDSVTTIGEGAFSHCLNLTSVNIPNSVTTIGERAFHCSNLTRVNIPNSVTFIGMGVFADCTNLTSIEVDENNQHYKSIDGNLYSKDGTILIQYATGKTDVTFEIPSNVTTIGGQAFYGCYHLTDVILGDNVTTLCDSAFEMSSIHSIVIPNSITTIGYKVFYCCSNLTSVVIPNSVTSIDDCAFYGCYNLTSIEIPDSVTSIGDYAFLNCSNLASVVIPDSITSIGEWAFYYCTKLTNVVIPNGVEFIGENAFYDCNSLTDVKFSDPAGWYVSKNIDGSDPIEISANDLKDSNISATLLMNKFKDYYWFKN